MAKKHKNRVRKPDKLKLTATRNPLFNHPLMSKSHHHDKPYKADRRAAKVKLHSNYRSVGSCDSQNTMEPAFIYGILRNVRSSIKAMSSHCYFCRLNFAY